MDKRIVYDPHAALRMRGRGFRPADVEWILETGTVADPGPIKGHEPRLAKERMIRGHMARMIYLERADHYYVITVFWVTPGGR
jgi:hypothetical protein